MNIEIHPYSPSKKERSEADNPPGVVEVDIAEPLLCGIRGLRGCPGTDTGGDMVLKGGGVGDALKRGAGGKALFREFN